MSAFLRQFFVVLLVLLQMAAPLVHAHVGEDSRAHGFHLYEFDRLHAVQDGAVLSSCDHEFGDQAIVNVGSAIKQTQLIIDIQPALLFVSSLVNTDVDVLIGEVNFSPHPSGFVSDPFLSHNTSRAPPR